MPVYNSVQFNLGIVPFNSNFSFNVNIKTTNSQQTLNLQDVSLINSTQPINLLTNIIETDNFFTLIDQTALNTTYSLNLNTTLLVNNNTFNLINLEDININYDLNVIHKTRSNIVIPILPAYNVNDLNRSDIIELDIIQESKVKATNTLYLNSSSNITQTGQLSQIDDFPPYIINTSPASGTILNDPFADVYFKLIDNSTTSIVSSSVNIFINNSQYVTNGIITQPNTFFNIVSLSEYEFLYTNPSGFNLGSFVTISGSAKDSLNNSGTFLYSYKVWDTNTLNVFISGAPDIYSPYILSTDPINASTGVDTNKDIKIILRDDHTGINKESLYIDLNNEIIISGSALNNNFGIYNLNLSVDKKELEVIIKPNISFDFEEVINLNISVSDNYLTPNIFSGALNFITEINSYLIVSGLHIFDNTNFIPFDIENIFNSNEPTQFYIDYINTSGTGIALPESKIIKNGNIIQSNFVSISGSESYYRVFFELEPDYHLSTLINFYIQAKGEKLSLGSQADLYAKIVALDSMTFNDLNAQIIPNIIFVDLIGSITSSKSYSDLSGAYTPRTNFTFKNFSKELLWGYEVCVSGEKLPYESDILLNLSTENYSCGPKKSNYINKFSTVNYPSSDLKAEIYGEGFNKMTLSGYIESINPFFEYGKTMNLVLEAKDYAGNKLEFSWSFKIEDK